MATIKGSSETNRILGLQDDDTILAGRGNDTIDAGSGNDRIFADYGDDRIDGGEGNDSLFGEHGNDTLDGGAGSDRVSGGRGDDLGIYKLDENQGSADYYDGGEGSDTLRLMLTQEQASSSQLLADIEAFQQFLAQNNHPDRANNPTFHFSTFDLTARNWEHLELVVEPSPQPPVISISDAEAIEGGTLTFVVSVDKADLNNPITATYTIAFDPPGIGVADQSDLAPQTLLTGEVKILPGQTSATVSVSSIDDQLIEGPETFTVTLSDLSANAQPGDLQATGTIIDDEEVECGYSWGDPHYVTADGLIYDMQSCGEFVFVETSNANDPNPVIVQTRTASYGPNVSVNTAVATLVDGHRVTIDTQETQQLRIDGQTMDIASGSMIPVGSGQIHFSAGIYSIIYPNQEHLIVSDYGGYINLRFCASADRPDGSLRGLLGNFDGNAANDLTTRDGIVLPTQATFEQLYTTFADSWRISQAESLFDYRLGENTGTFTNLNCPLQKTSVASLPQDKVAAAIALLDAAGITDPALREAAILDYALTCDASFITGAGHVGTPTERAIVIDPTIVWTNGGEVIIGTSDAPSQFSIGTNAAPANGIPWTGASPSDDWSEAGNWTPSTPSATDEVVFTSIGAGGINVVDQDFSIAALHYTGEVAPVTYAADHITDLKRVSKLAILGDATVGVANPESRVNLVIANGTAVTAHVTELNVGLNSVGSGRVTGNVNVTSGAALNAADVAAFSIGRETGAADGTSTAANGSLKLGSHSTLTLGSDAAPASLNIGWSQNTNTYHASGSANGVLDAIDPDAVLDLQLSELNVGRGSYAGFGTGTLKWNQTEAITASSVTFGRGYATGSLDVPASGEFHLGSGAAPTGTLRIAYNDAGGGTATANLDFAATNPTFTAFIADDLSIGRETGAADGTSTAANGSLKLGSHSTLTLGSDAAPASLNIGWSQNTNTYHASGSATGVLDATEGSLIANLATLRIGQTNNAGTAAGKLVMGAGASVTANQVGVGMGSGGSGTLIVLGGALTFTGASSALDFGTGVLELPGGSFAVGSPVEAVSALRIGYNNFATGTASTAIDLSAANPTFTAFIADDLSIGRETGAADGTSTAANGSLKLGSHSTLTLGSDAAPASLNIGWSQNTNTYHASGSANGVLDAIDPDAVLDLQLSELNVGRGSYAGFGTGTLKWNQTEAITASSVTFGRGYATGSLDVPASGEFHLGSGAAPTGTLRIAYNDAGGGTATANLDFAATNPTFTAFIADDLSIGRETGAADGTSTAANGSLKLGSHSTLTLGSDAAPASLNIGWSQNTNTYHASGSATGVLDATEGSLIANLATLRIGQTNNAGTAAGKLVMGAGASVTANQVGVGMGSGGSGTLIVLGGALTFTGASSALDFGTGVLELPGGSFAVGSPVEAVSALRIGYNNFATGTASTAIDLSAANPTFTAFIADDLSIGRETGAADGTSTAANGSLKLGSHSTLTLGSDAAPASLNIGWSQNTNTYHASGSANGVLDAIDPDAVLDLQLSELNVGRGSYAGFGTGTLKWNQTEAITASSVTFGRGYATGSLDVPASGEFHLGSGAAPTGTLRIAYNDAGGGTATANLDFAATNPTFTAFIADDLSIGRETGAADGTSTAANGSLKLGSHSTLTLGSDAAPASLNIGWSQNTNTYHASGSATGVLDATEGSLIANLATLRIGQTNNAGTAAGKLVMGAGASVTANQVGVGMGSGGSGTLIVLGGALTFTGASSALDFGTGVLELPGGSFAVGSPVEAVSALRIGYNNFATGTASTAIDLSAANPTFTAFIADDLSIGRETGAADGTSTAANGSLKLGSHSTLTLGSDAAPASLNIGWSQNTNTYHASGSANGVLDAIDPDAVLDLQLSELNVGRGSYAGFGTGTLKWNQTEAITASSVTFGRGYATGSLDVPASGEFHLGSGAAPTGTLRIAYNDAGGGTATANLDFAATNPTFTAFIADDLSIGRETGAADGTSTAANGSLKLGSHSTLTLGSDAAPASLNIGWSQNTNTYHASGSATGVLDATEGSLIANLATLRIGQTNNAGTAAGDLILGNAVSVDTNTANIGVGSGASGTVSLVDYFSGSFNAATVNLANGLFDFGVNSLEIGGSGAIQAQTFNLSGGLLIGNTVNLNSVGSFNFAGGRLDVETFNGTLDESGGTLAPGDTAPGSTTVNGDYHLSASGTLEINLGGPGAGTGYDQLLVNGRVDLTAGESTGGTLDLVLAFAAQVNDRFLIVENDQNDVVSGEFLGLPDGGTVQESFGGYLYTFLIDYAGGDGNDIELTVSDIAAEATPLLSAHTASESGAVSAAPFLAETAPAELAVLPPPAIAEPGSQSTTPAALPDQDGVGGSSGDCGNDPAVADAGSEALITDTGSEIVRFDALLLAIGCDEASSDGSIAGAPPEPGVAVLPLASGNDSSSASDTGIDAPAEWDDGWGNDQDWARPDDANGSTNGGVATLQSDEVVVQMTFGSVDFVVI